MFADDPEERSYQKLKKKWYLMPSCLTLSIIRYGSKGESGVTQVKEGHSFLHLCVVAIEKGPFGLPSTKVANFIYFLLLPNTNLIKVFPSFSLLFLLLLILVFPKYPILYTQEVESIPPPTCGSYDGIMNLFDGLSCPYYVSSTKGDDLLGFIYRDTA